MQLLRFVGIGLFAVFAGCDDSLTASGIESVSIAIHPTSASLTVGSVDTLTATLKDESGQPTDSPSVRWASSHPSIVSIDTSGVLLAESAGAAEIYAHALANADTALVDVTDATPVFVEGFESGDLTHSENGYSWGNTHSADGTNGAFTENSHDGSYSFRIQFAGQSTSDDNSLLDLNFDTASPEELWIEYYVYVPDNFNHLRASSGASNNKWLQVWAGGRSSEDIAVTGTLWPNGGGGSNATWARGHDYVPNSGKGHTRVNDDHIVTPGEQGEWRQMRWHVKVSDDNTDNGVVEVWKDGILVYSDTSLYDLNDEDPANTHWDHIRWFGWANVGYEDITNWYIDDIKIYESNPGW